MTSHTLLRLLALMILSVTVPGWADTAIPVISTSAAAASSTVDVPASTATPAAATATAAASTDASAAPAVSTVSATAVPAAASTAPAVEAAAPASAPEAPAATAPAPTAAPVYVPANTTGLSMPVRGMNMENVEHIFGTPLEKREAVGKPPITSWVYADYVVYFEYNMVLHTVMKSGPFSDSKAPPDGNG